MGGRAEERQPACRARPVREACFRRGQPGSESGGARGQGPGPRLQELTPGPGRVGPARVLGAELDGVDRGENGAEEVRTARDTLPGKSSVQSGGGRRAFRDQRGGSLRTGEALSG